MEQQSGIPEILRRWPGHTGNWGRWPNDRGTLNLLTPEVALRGVRAVCTGQTIPCARPLETKDPIRDTPTAVHQMLTAGKWDKDPARNVQSASDSIQFRVHGMVNTHIDAFSHIGYEGYGFNGRPFADMVSMEEGAKLCDITDMVSIVTRGIFVDVARARGVRHLAHGDSVKPEEVAEAAKKLQPGDAIVIRLGCTLSGGLPPAPESPDKHGTWAGLHADTIELLASKDVSVIASDSVSDTFPSPVIQFCKSPVHVLCLAFYGIPLLHNMDLEALAQACAVQERDNFMFVVSPLNVPKATGSLCTPVAIL